MPRLVTRDVRSRACGARVACEGAHPRWRCAVLPKGVPTYGLRCTPLRSEPGARIARPPENNCTGPADRPAAALAAWAACLSDAALRGAAFGGAWAAFGYAPPRSAGNTMAALYAAAGAVVTTVATGNVSAGLQSLAAAGGTSIGSLIGLHQRATWQGRYCNMAAFLSQAVRLADTWLTS